MPQIADFASILTSSFSAELADAVNVAALPGLGEGPCNEVLLSILNSGDPALQLSTKGAAVQEITSGLWLLAGDLDRSHTISQDLPGAEGSFLHGIMHRREGDFGNAKYWFRRVGDHPVFDQITKVSGAIYDGPLEFVDACSDAQGGGDEEGCIEAQWCEWQCLMAYLC